MTERTDFYALSYDHRGDIEHYLRVAHAELGKMRDAWNDLNNDPDHEQTRRREDAIYCLQAAEHLNFAAERLTWYAAGLARFEHATWQQIGDVFDSSKQAASERFRAHAESPRRGDKTGTLTRHT